MAKNSSSGRSSSNGSSRSNGNAERSGGQRGKSTANGNKRGGSQVSSRNSGSRSAGGRGNAHASNGRAQGGQQQPGNGANEGLMKLFLHQLADLYYVEKQLMKVLPKMADRAHDDALADAFMEHASETEAQVERLEEVFEMLDRSARGKRCEAMDGILDEAKELMDEFKNDPALDAALVCAAQKVEHYEIATYGSVCAYAEELGLDDAAALLADTLEEEKHADALLTDLAEGAINSSADTMGDDQEEGNEEGARSARGERSREASYA